MKKIFTILSIMLISMFMLAGCAKCIDKKEKIVKVKIVNEYYKPEEEYITMFNGRPFVYTDQAEYEITVDYKGTEHFLYGADTYQKYYKRIGEKVSAILVTKTYDNGNIEQYIDRLGEM